MSDFTVEFIADELDDSNDLSLMANAIRALSMDAVEKAKSGHPGMPMGMADIATVLFAKYMKFDPAYPRWPDRDRFVLSNGHGSMLLYSLSYLTGYSGMTLEQIKNFRQLGYHTAGHPEHNVDLGIETTTGPLGQGIANAVGMAIAEQHLQAIFGTDLVDHYTYVFCGDGCLAEGISHEAASLAGHLKLNKLIMFFDDNGITIDGDTSLSTSDDVIGRFQSYGWQTIAIDGHDMEQISYAIEKAQSSDRPTIIACKTIIGYGSPNKAGTSSVHGAALGAEEVQLAKETLDWPYEAFEIPQDVLDNWRAVGDRGAIMSASWQHRFDTQPEDLQRRFTNHLNTKIPIEFDEAIKQVCQEFDSEKPNQATRQTSERVLNAIVPTLPFIVGGSADLTGSNNTLAKSMRTLDANNYIGNYIYYGVREHAMGSVMNGMALHGGIIPYGGTFLAFSDYCRPSIRLASLMNIQNIFVMTHDSIGLGEDGPTHQPVEHLASLRAIPNLRVFRPADAIEVAECWHHAIHDSINPSLLVLTRQKLPMLRSYSKENKSNLGGYVLSQATGECQITLIATGSEVSIAMSAKAMLEAGGIGTAVVSMPCMELFELQSKEYRAEVLGIGIRIAIEAAVVNGWERYISDNDAFIGMKGFGASAPAEALYKHFNITAEAVVKKAKHYLNIEG